MDLEIRQATAANFPTVRLSQLAAMLSETGGLFSKTIEACDIKQLKNLFEVTASGYWDDHYVFGKKSRFCPKSTDRWLRIYSL